MSKKSEINITKQFWAIVKSGDPNGYHTGKKYMEIALYEFDTPKELEDFLADGSVESGESMGDYVFKVLALSHTHRVLNALTDEEEVN